MASSFSKEVARTILIDALFASSSSSKLFKAKASCSSPVFYFSQLDYANCIDDLNNFSR